MDKILDNKKLFNHCGDARLVGKSLRELLNMKKGEDEEFSFCAYVGTTMQLLEKEFLRWLLKRGAMPANLSKLIRAAQARKEAGTFRRTVFCPALTATTSAPGRAGRENRTLQCMCIVH